MIVDNYARYHLYCNMHYHIPYSANRYTHYARGTTHKHLQVRKYLFGYLFTNTPSLKGNNVTNTIPQLVNVEHVSGGWINKYILTYQLPNGKLYSYESVSRKKPEAYQQELDGNAAGKSPVVDAVCIVPILPDGSVLLIKEFRYPLNSWCISFPAGLIEPGENLIDCINRELHEETGYCIRQDLGDAAITSFTQSGFSSTGLTEENVRVVFAHVEQHGEAQPELNELIEPFILKREEIATFLTENTLPIGTRCQLALGILAAAGK